MPLDSTAAVIAAARTHLERLRGHTFDVIEVAKPVSPEAASNLAKVISKLSPLVGNLIEFNTCEYLNDQPEFKGLGTWRRQDPGFPDTVFDGAIKPTPGFEIKAWFPLATEITARFKDSQNHFANDQTYVAMLAWLPEFLIYGKPKIIDIVIVSGRSAAEARDGHYHDPPDYLVMEPENTAARTANLQQTNTNGYKWQPNEDDEDAEKRSLKEAHEVVQSWGEHGRRYSVAPAYQARLRDLMGRYKYRLDTNFAKMDRIGHADIEAFKERVYRTEVHDLSIGQWNQLLSRGDEALIKKQLADHFGIKDVDQPVVE